MNDFRAVLADMQAERIDSADRERDVIRRVERDVQAAYSATRDANIFGLCHVFCDLSKSGHITAHRDAMACIADAIAELRALEVSEAKAEAEFEGQPDHDVVHDARRDARNAA